MPTYDYACLKCDHKFEVRQKITDDALSTCPSCNEKSLQRGVGGGLATFRFMGEGFYITDYKKEKDGCSNSTSCCPCKND